MDVEKIREDFPILQKNIIYFDNACVTLRPMQVIEAMNEYYEEYPACAGRSTHRLGKKAEEKYNEARNIIAKFINAKKEEIIFTRNTTEGLNLLAYSLNLNKNDIVLTTDREHNSNLLPWQVLAKNGIRHKIIMSKDDTSFDLESFQKMMNKDVRVVSMVHSSNLDGYTIPAKEIIEIAHDNNALVILDGAQSVPHKEVDVKKLDVDFLCFSGHKMLGPSGIGVLYGKKELLEDLNPFLLGGDTVQSSTYTSHVLLKPPEKFEAGLQNYAGAIGLAKAAQYLDKIGRNNIEKHEQELNKFITEELSGIIEIIGPEVEKRSGIISFNVNGMNFHDVAVMLDELKNIMVRSGQHCVHSWFDAHKIEGSVRASLYLYNTKEEAQIFINTIKEIAKMGR